MSQPGKRAPELCDLRSMEGEHRMLEDLLRRHQEALVGFEFSSALAELEEFARRLRRHMALEEKVLIPAYAGLADLPRAGQPGFFVDEHRKIEARIEAILTAARSLSAGSGTRGAVVSLLEREMRVKTLLEHHQSREETTLLPRLERHLGRGGPPS
ncbi:MAG: hemerythrin domain-containing protein [Elusimicrobiota bacterium]